MKLKHMTRLALSLALAAALGGSALASPVPKDLVTENLNGQQRMVKTYELPPDTDSDTLVGDTLAPSAYQAVATYSAATSYQVPTGYITTADYKGEVTSEGVGSVTYTVVYAGKEIVPEPEESTGPFGPDTPYFAIPVGTVVAVLLVLLAAGLAGAGVYFFLHRKNVCIYVPGDRPQDYKLVGKFHVQPDAPEVDITGLEPYPEGIIAVEVKRPLAKKLIGQDFTVHHRAGDEIYTILHDQPGDWYEFDPAAQNKEDAI